MVQDAARHGGRWHLMLLACSLALTAVDFVLTSAALGLGPGGADGSRPGAADQALLQDVAIGAGAVGVLLGAAAAGAVLLSTGATRTRLLSATVAVQLVATVILWTAQAS